VIGGVGSGETTVWEVAERALSGQEVLEQQVRYQNSMAGQKGYAQVSAAPLFEQGRVARVVVVASDIGRLKAVEHAKDEFLSVASHELKSPLTSVKGYAQLVAKYLDSGASSETVVKMARTIVEQSDRVVQQVDRLLDLSRAQMGRLVMKPEPVDLAELTRAHVQAIQVKTDKHRLVTELNDGLTGMWDRAYLGQVITNLLENAVRYSPSGGEVRVAARRENGAVLLKVSDQGIGIPKEMQAKVFERHFRTEDAKKVKADGMGIGLYLVQQIVTAHEGRIWVESEPGCGSSFTVELPVGPGD
jgi:signal transduction histidine kinase